MGKDDAAPLNVNTDKSIPRYLLDQIKFTETLNLKRYKQFKRELRVGRISGSILGSFVLGIYFYTMYAVRSESFLDDFDLPELEYVEGYEPSN